jgi:tetratricopeptide (TPR) repeat protein
MYAQAAHSELELGRPADALVSLARADECFELCEPAVTQTLAGLRATAARLLGDDASMIAEAGRTRQPHFAKLAERLAARPDGTRVRLDTRFVRQHHKTCVPTILATLAHYWERPADHLEIADKICFDGTSSHSARRWAEQHGWATREFTVTWDVARALVDRRIPFVVDTVHATSAHAQAIIGYDERWGTFLVRDPFVPATVEMLAHEFLENSRAHGPRGFALVPAERASLLDGIDFPDQELYAALASVDAALDGHDRTAALARAGELETRGPGHRLGWMARRAIGSYDANPYAVEASIEAGLAAFPNEVTLLVALFHVLPRTSAPASYRARLEELCRDRTTHPMFRELLATDLANDGRRVAEAETLARETARLLHDRGATLALLAACAWSRLDHARGLELYRLAACLEPLDAAASETYFRAAACRGQADVALRFLRARADEQLRKSPAAVIALFHALEHQGTVSEAFEVLERGLAARPDDGALLRFAAEADARTGSGARAAERLAAAETRSPRTAWLRSAALVATYAGEHARALECLRAVVELEPYSAEAHGPLAQQIERVSGRAAAREHVAGASARFPENAALLELRAQWLEGGDPAELETVLRSVIALQPANAWAQRELVLTFLKLGRVDDARAAQVLARAIAPTDPRTELVAATIARQSGDVAEERRACRAAIELSADTAHAIIWLVQLAPGAAERAEELAWIEERVAAGSVGGEGIAAWFATAGAHLEPADLARRTEALCARRSDAWWAWACRTRLLRDQGHAADAIAAGEELARRFPLVPGSWHELASALRAAKEPQRELAAFERAFAIAPGWTDAVTGLADAQQRAGEAETAVKTLERGLHHQPLDASLLLAHADALRKLGRNDAALASVRRVLEHDPANGDAWAKLAEWDASGHDAALTFAEDLAERRPWDLVLTLRVAEVQGAKRPRAALATIERALARDPRSIEAHELKSAIAAHLRDRALAEAACAPAVFGAQIPWQLRARKACVAAEFGEFKSAIAQMLAVVAERPDHAHGFQLVADWAQQVGDTQHGLEAARALVRLHPNVAAAHSYLGDALAAAGSAAEAGDAFRRAIELDPTNRFAASRLLTGLVEARKLDVASATVEELARHLPPGDVAYWRLCIAAKRGRWPAVEPLVRAFVAEREVDAWPLERACEDLARLHGREARRGLHALALEPTALARAGSLWARVCVAQRALPGARALRRACARNPEVAAHALHVILEHCAEQRKVGRLAWIVIWNRSFIRSRDELWASVGYARVRWQQNALAVHWMRDHDRRDVPQWALLNLATALRALGAVQRAQAIHRLALERPADHTHAFHSVAVAFEAALTGQVDEADALLERSKAEVAQLEPQNHWRLVHALATALVELEQAPADRRRLRAGIAFSALAPLFANRVRGVAMPRTIQWRRVARHIGKLGGGPWLYVRGYWDTVATWLVAALFTFLVALYVIAFFRNVVLRS